MTTLEATTAPPAPHPVRRELGEVVHLAVPVILSQVGIMFMGVVDTLMLGHYSAIALAAGALANIVSYTLLILGMGILSALDPLVSQAHGAGDRAAVGAHLGRGLVLATALTLPFSLALWWLRPVFTAFGEAPEVVAAAETFTRALVWGVAPYFLTVALRQTLQAMSLVRPALYSIVVGNLANLLGNWLLIFGHWGLPRLGVAGSAHSTAAARWLMLLTLAFLARRQLVPLLAIPLAELRRLRSYLLFLRLGLPIGLHNSLELGMFAALSLLMGRLGVAALAGHQIAINLASLSFMVPLGLAGAATTRVGNAIGRGELAAARRAAAVCYALGVGAMAVFAALFALFPRFLAGLYSNEPAVVAMAATLLPLAATFQVFDGAQVVGTGILRGTADTAVPASIALLGFWLLGLPVASWLAFGAGFGAAGMWWGMTLSLAAVALLLAWRILRRFRSPLLRVEGAAQA